MRTSRGFRAVKDFVYKNLVIEDKKEQLQKTYGILMEKEIDQEVMNMCNFSDFIEQRGKKGLDKDWKRTLQGREAEGKATTGLLCEKTDAENRCQCGGCHEYAGC